jgi:preprotein translocase subunit SecA
VLDVLGLDLPVVDWGREEGIDESGIRERIQEAADNAYAARAANAGIERVRDAEKSILLMVFDKVWKDHLLSLDHLRQGIGLRAYGQRDPLNEYKSEAFNLFNAMLGEMREETTRWLMQVNLSPEMPVPSPEPIGFIDARHPAPDSGDPLLGYDAVAGEYGTAAPLATARVAEGVDPNDPSTWDRTPRNAPCPCGSGKKYKHCHGRA